QVRDQDQVPMLLDHLDIRIAVQGAEDQVVAGFWPGHGFDGSTEGGMQGPGYGTIVLQRIDDHHDFRQVAGGGAFELDRLAGCEHDEGGGERQPGTEYVHDFTDRTKAATRSCQSGDGYAPRMDSMRALPTIYP